MTIVSNRSISCGSVIECQSAFSCMQNAAEASRIRLEQRLQAAGLRPSVDPSPSLPWHSAAPRHSSVKPVMLGQHQAPFRETVATVGGYGRGLSARSPRRRDRPTANLPSSSATAEMQQPCSAQEAALRRSTKKGAKESSERIPHQLSSLFWKAPSGDPRADCSAREKAAEVKTCSICLDEVEVLQPMTLLPCGHAFHHACVGSWLAAGKLTCPNCRFSFSQ